MGATAGVGVGPGHIPNARARASGDQCYRIKKQCLCSSDLENVLGLFFFCHWFQSFFHFLRLSLGMFTESWVEVWLLFDN